LLLAVVVVAVVLLAVVVVAVLELQHLKHYLLLLTTQ
jgi:hypothetical protein